MCGRSTLWRKQIGPLLLPVVEFPIDSRFVFAAPSTLVGSRLVLRRRLQKILFLPPPSAKSRMHDAVLRGAEAAAAQSFELMSRLAKFIRKSQRSDASGLGTNQI